MSEQTSPDISVQTQCEVEFEMDNTSMNEAVRLLQKTLIYHALEVAKGNKAKASRLLGMKRPTFIAMLKRIQTNEVELN